MVARRPYSTATETAKITVTPVNDAPVLDNSGDMALGNVLEDDVANAGTLITDLIASAGGDRITDVDADAVEGIAVTAADTANGAWEYSTNNGGAWSAIGSISSTSARLLASDANTRIRFVPDPNYNGAIDPAITFRAWDQSSGANGGSGDPSTNGGTTAFSTATDTASVIVLAVNDAPVLDTSGDMSLNTISEDDFSSPGTLISELIASAGGDRITDVDAGAVEGIAIIAADAANGAWQYSTNDGTDWNPLGSVSSTSSRLLASDSQTRIRFIPNADFSGTVDPAIAFRAWDQTSGANGTPATRAAMAGRRPSARRLKPRA